MRRIAVFLGGAIVLAGVAGFAALRVPSVQDAVFVRMVTRRLPANSSPLMQDDALRVVVCGSSSPLPDPHRARSCVAVIAGGKIYVVDTGPDSASRLNSFHLPLEKMAGVFLTHFHSDHIGDLGEMNFNSWGAGRTTPLVVYGPPGVEQVVAGFNMAYGADHGYRTAHHTEAVMPHEAADMQAEAIALSGEPDAAMDRVSAPLVLGDLRVTAIEVDHRPVVPAYAYRFDYKGRSVTISGDTKYHPPLAVAAKNSDVLIHEAQSQHLVGLMQQIMADNGRPRLAHIMHDIQNYHTDTADAARIANAAGVKLVIYTHFTPPLVSRLLEHAFFQDAMAVRPEGWMAAHDGLMVSLPLGGDEVRVGEVE